MIGYVLLALILYFMQRSLQYFPVKTSPGTPEANGMPAATQVLKLPTADGLELLAWYVPPREDVGKLVVMFHGNAGHIGFRAVKARYFAAHGYGVLMPEYRGYGGNRGKPSEEGFYLDARAAMAFAAEQGYQGDDIILYGESIGTGVAVQMATEITPRYLVLEAPFSSALDVARLNYYWLPLDWLMHDRFDSLSKIAKVKTLSLIVHGDEDIVIPIDLAKRLFERANHPKEFITINGGGHADLYEHHLGHVLVEWLDKKEAERKEP
jgi:fermentation-respiration switch protein FrsA (DUF1100 family)